MQEFIDTVEKILMAEAETGSLAGLNVITNEHEQMDIENCMIIRNRENTVSQNGKIKVVEGFIFLTVSKRVNKLEDEALHWKDAERGVESLARSIETVLLANPQLPNSDLTASQLVANENKHMTEIPEITYGNRQDQDGHWYAGLTMTLKAQYIYRSGVVVLR